MNIFPQMLLIADAAYSNTTQSVVHVKIDIFFSLSIVSICDHIKTHYQFTTTRIDILNVTKKTKKLILNITSYFNHEY